MFSLFLVISLLLVCFAFSHLLLHNRLCTLVDLLIKLLLLQLLHLFLILLVVVHLSQVVEVHRLQFPQVAVSQVYDLTLVIRFLQNSLSWGVL